MRLMNIPAGYAVLTAGLVLLCLILLVTAGWSRKKAVIAAALGMCTITSIFVIDVITDGTAMYPRLALILAGAGVALMLPLGLKGARAVRTMHRAAKPARSNNPPDSSRRPAAAS